MLIVKIMINNTREIKDSAFMNQEQYATNKNNQRTRKSS